MHDERTSTDPDGGYYVRTGDHDGEQQVRKAFYALDVHLMVGVDVRNPDRQYLPGCRWRCPPGGLGPTRLVQPGE